MKLPTWDPGTETKVSSTLPRHVSIAAWPWSCERDCPFGENPWFWATTAGVSCTTVHEYHVLKLFDSWVTGLALYFLQPTGWTLYVPVTGMPASTLISHATPRKVVLRSGESTLFLAFSRNPNLSCGQKWHLDAELPTDATELESTNRRYSSFMWIHWRRRGARVASTHFVKVRGGNNC